MKIHDMRITATGDYAFDSGRPCYRVECVTCGVVVHENTTGPQVRVAQHFENAVSNVRVRNGVAWARDEDVTSADFWCLGTDRAG